MRDGLPDPDVVQFQVNRLNVVRNMLDDTRRDVLVRAARVRWNGRRADRMRAEVRGISGRVGQVNSDLGAVVNDLVRHKHWIERERADLLDIERRIRNWMYANPAGSGQETGRCDASAVAWIPPRYSRHWRSVLTSLRRLGAAV